MKANFLAKYSPNSLETEWKNGPFYIYNIYLQHSPNGKVYRNNTIFTKQKK